jgi:hypothetical protein
MADEFWQLLSQALTASVTGPGSSCCVFFQQLSRKLVAAVTESGSCRLGSGTWYQLSHNLETAVGLLSSNLSAAMLGPAAAAAAVT